MKRSSWSRQGDACEVDDASRDEALTYLKCQNVDEEIATKIYDLVGGRMIHLQYVTGKVSRGDATLQTVRHKLFFDANSQLETAEVLPGHPMT